MTHSKNLRSEKCNPDHNLDHITTIKMDGILKRPSTTNEILKKNLKICQIAEKIFRPT